MAAGEQSVAAQGGKAHNEGMARRAMHAVRLCAPHGGCAQTPRRARAVLAPNEEPLEFPGSHVRRVTTGILWKKWYLSARKRLSCRTTRGAFFKVPDPTGFGDLGQASTEGGVG